MILNKYKFYNTLGREIEMLPIADFLTDHPDYGEHLAKVIKAWTDDPSEIGATRIQRKIAVRYEIADAMMNALLCAGIAVRQRAPARLTVCLDADEGQRLAEFIIDSVEDRTPEEDKWLLKEAMESAFDMYYTPREEKNETPSEDFYITDGRLSYYKGRDENITIPDGVTSICRCSFTHNENIRTAQLPIGLEVIDRAAFRGCVRLESISFPHTLKVIGCASFRDCKSLTEINIPDSVEELDTGAFSGCDSLMKLRLSENLSSIPERAFFGCKKLLTVRIPDFVSVIGSGAFAECDGLKTAYVPKDTQVCDDSFPPHTKIVRI